MRSVPSRASGKNHRLADPAAAMLPILRGEAFMTQ